MKGIGRHYCVHSDIFCLGKDSRGWVELLLAYRGARCLEFDSDGTSQIWSHRGYCIEIEIMNRMIVSGIY